MNSDQMPKVPKPSGVFVLWGPAWTPSEIETIHAYARAYAAREMEKLRAHLQESMQVYAESYHALKKSEIELVQMKEIDALLKAEREACAQACDERVERSIAGCMAEVNQTDERRCAYTSEWAALRDCASAIRGRSYPGGVQTIDWPAS